MKQIIADAISLAEKYGAPCTQDLRNLERSVQGDLMKVVVMGDFKAGKSTLINSLFLRKNLLPVDHQEATAVPTHLRNGAEIVLRMYKRLENGASQLVRELHNPDATLIASHITADSEEKRASLAKEYSYVELEMPGILPEGIELVDTPGLNTTNREVVAGTQYESRTADAIIYVRRAAQLADQEIERIRSLSGNQIRRFPVHVVLTSEPTQSEVQTIELANEIKNRLYNYGVSVDCSIFRLGGSYASVMDGVKPEVQKSTPSAFGKSRARMGGAATAPVSTPTPEPMTSSAITKDSTYRQLVDFLNRDAGSGRAARLAREVKPILSTLQMHLSGMLSLSDKSAEDLVELKKVHEKKRRQYHMLVCDLLEDVRRAQITFKDDLRELLQNLQAGYVERLTKAANDGNIWGLVSNLQREIPSDVSIGIERLTLDLQHNIRKISNQYGVDGLTGRLNIGDGESDLNIDMGFLANLPGWLVTVLDYATVVITSPLPWFIDIPMRMLADKIEWLKKILPAGILAGLVQTKVQSTLDTVMNELKEKLTTALDERFKECNAQLSEYFDKQSPFVLADVDDAELSAKVLSDEQKSSLTQDVEQVKAWINQL